MQKQVTAEDLLVRGIENNDLTLSDLKELIAYTQKNKSSKENSVVDTIFIKPKED